MDRGAWPFVGGVTFVVNSVSVREEGREKTREDEREEMKKCFFFEKCLKTKKKRQTNLSHNDSKKKNRRTNHSFESSEYYPCFQLCT